MQDKLAQLTEKLYGEGLEKGQREGEAILAKAKEDAKSIEDRAQATAANIIEVAKKEASAIIEAAKNEIAQAGKNTLNTVKLQLEESLLNNTLQAHLTDIFAEGDFFKSLILTAAQGFNSNNQDNPTLCVLLPEEMQDKLLSVFTKTTKQTFDKEFELIVDKNIKAGFKIGTKNGGYYLTFTQQGFESLLKEYLRPKTRKILFGE
ncbi:MAG: hypothetical protein ACRC9X_04410 [Bacteroidales bacterium]